MLFVEDLGVEIGQIHNGASFNQKPWLKEYIDFNTEKRKEAKNEFEKDFFKLMNNSVFGKTMENVRNRANITLMIDYPDVEKIDGKMSTPIGVSNRRLSTESKLLRRLANPNLDSVKILMKICVILHKQKIK